MKISKEVAETLNNPKTLETLVEESGKVMVQHIEELNSTRDRTTVSAAGKIFSEGNLVNRQNDTLKWDSQVHMPVFSSDDSVVRCPVYSEANDSAEVWRQSLPFMTILRDSGYAS
jgi:hypothetical protein